MRKKLWLTSLLAALSITAAGGIAIAKNQATVTKAAENWQIGEISDEYLYGDSFSVPNATVEVNGEMVAATATVTYPDGTMTNTATVKLNQAGQYVVTYRAQVNGVHCIEKKFFNVGSKSYLVQDAKSSVQYGTYTDYGANSEGLLVRLAQKDTLTFAKLIDMNSLSPADTIFEAFITPDSQGSYDFSDLYVTLTDAVDPSVYLQYRIQRWRSTSSGRSTAFVAVNGNGQTFAGYENNKGYHIGKDGHGAPITFTFTGTKHSNGWNGDVLPLEPDAHTAKLQFNPVNLEAKANGVHIAQMDSYDCFESPWTGFPSGKAKLSVSAGLYSGNTANFCIKSVLGVDLKNESFFEEDKPMISVDMAQDEMPNGTVGYAYKIPTATAFDYASGVCEVKTTVYRDYASNSPISVSVLDGKFKPATAGWYTIVYTAKDLLGNTQTETRNVYVAQDLGDITVELPDNRLEEATLGQWVPVDKATYSGDCGIAEMQVVAKLGDTIVDVTDGFRPEVAGEWQIIYTVTDYIGRVGSNQYTVNAVASDNIVVVDTIVLPPVYVADCEYILPKLVAYDYSSGARVEKLCDVIVTDKNGEKTYKAGDAFVPAVAESGDKIKVTYSSNGVTLVEKAVPTVIVKNGDKIIAKNYLYGEGITTSYKDENDEWYSAGAAIIANENSKLCGWTFATPQLVNDFSVILECLAARANFDGFVITLTDAFNSEKSISLTIKKKGAGSTISAGGAWVDIAAAGLAVNKQYTIGYTDGKFSFADVNIPVNTMVNGEQFTGFSSSLVYLRVETINAEQGAAYKIRSVNGANITRRNLDNFAPQLQVLGDAGGEYSLNSVYEISPAIANDVFSLNTTLTMTVSAPDGTVVLDNNGLALENVSTDKSYFITLSSYGKYQISYAAVEENWVTENPLVIEESVFVVDEDAPLVVFKNATQTTAKLGDTITQPDIAYQDNLTSEEELHIVRAVINPYGRMYIFDENENAIKCMYVGEYRFMVMVSDARGNCTSITHTITVTE